MRFLWVLVFLPLAACFDAEADLRFSDDEMVTADIKMTLGLQLHNMLQLGGPSGAGRKSICPKEAKTTVGTEEVVCEYSETRTLEEALAEVDEAAKKEDFLEGVKLERLDKERLKLTFPLDFKQVEKPEELTEDNPMMPMMIASLTGHAIVLRVHALEVEQTNGKLAEDGKSTEFIIPATELLAPSGDLPEIFEVTFKYRSCGLLGLGC